MLPFGIFFYFETWKQQKECYCYSSFFSCKCSSCTIAEGNAASVWTIVFFEWVCRGVTTSGNGLTWSQVIVITPDWNPDSFPTDTWDRTRRRKFGQQWRPLVVVTVPKNMEISGDAWSWVPKKYAERRISPYILTRLLTVNTLLLMLREST